MEVVEREHGGHPNFLPQAQTLAPDVVNWRRHLHRHPELSFQEVKTTAFLEELLLGWGLQPVRRTPTGLWADIVGGGRSGASEGRMRTVAIRADIDALPIQEENTFAFRSQNDGAMHACGHDGHTAILLGVARLLLDLQAQLPGRIRLLFQPAEELPPGGALGLIEAGALDGVDAVIGLHLRSTLPTGRALVGSGPVMASADKFVIRVKGRGGHAAAPHDSVDALMCAAQLAVALQQIVSRHVDPMQPAVLTIGSFHSGSAFNVIAGEAELTGTVRTFDEGVRAQIESKMTEMVQDITRAFGAIGELEYEKGYPVLINHPGVVQVLDGTVRATMGDEAVLPCPPYMAAEDFARYTQERPGAFLFLGAGNEELGANFPHHHPRFTIDEAALPYGVALMAGAAWRLLMEGAA